MIPTSRSRLRALSVALALLLVSSWPAPSRAARPSYPTAPVREVVDDYHGTSVADPYRWLEDETNAEVKSWVEAENALTRRMLDRFPERAAIRARLERLWAASVASTPNIRADRFFYTRRIGLANQPALFVSRGKMKAGERVLLDPNSFSADGTVALDWYYPSPDGKLFAYGRSASGSELSTLHLLEVDTGRERPDQIPNTRFSSLAWQADGKAFYYSRYPAPGSVPAGDENYYRRVYYHRVGGDYAQDPLVYGENRPKEEWLDVHPSQDWRWLFLTRSLDWSKNDLFLRPLDGGRELVRVAEGLDGQVDGDISGNTLFLRTNVGAPRYRIVRAPVSRPGPESWTEVVPEGEGVIEGFEILGRRLVVQTLVDARSRLLVYDFGGKKLGEVSLPTFGTVSGLTVDPAGGDAYFSFTSFAYPTAVFRFRPERPAPALVERMDPGVDPDLYETWQEWYASKDGTRVPMFVVAKKGLVKDGSRPALLTGYGGFDISETPSFNRMAIAWIDRGGVYALANLRGGGEFGRAWHEAGRLDKKQNVFDDFIAAGEYLIREKYTSADRLAIDGRSNGGLLTGACVVQRPDLYRAAIVGVPLLDMLRYHKFSVARLWIPEYGSSDVPEQFKFLYAYSPYHHVRTGIDYPAVLLTTAESDTRVAPIHAMKMAARLQAATGGERPILLRVETKAGHGQGKPLTKSIDEQLDMLTFLLWQTGVLAEPTSAGETSSGQTPGR